MKPYWAEGISERDPFSFQEVYRYPEKELESYPSEHGHGKTVIVIGGGVAGLTAGLELSSRGYDVKILEESGRVGGRIRTHYFSPDIHAELGAMRIPSSHECTLHYAARFGLQRRTFVNYNAAGLYHLRGNKVRLADWRDAASRYDLKPSEHLEPTRLLESQMNLAMARLSGPEKYQLFHSRTPGIVEDYDKRTLRQHLEAAGLSDEAIEFLGQATGLIQYERASFLETLIDYFGLLRVQQYELVDGMEALPNAMARELSGRITLNASVYAVRDNGSSLKVHYRLDGEDGLAEADYVVCTVPARRSAMIDWHPRLPFRKHEALRRLYYASAAKTLVHVSERIWELESGIFGGGSFLDGPVQQVWYPSDNSTPSSDSMQRATITGDDLELTATASAPTRWKASDATRSRLPAAFTASYTWESNARWMASLSRGERTDEVLRSIEELHPGIGKLVLGVEHVVWDEESSLSGAFAYYAPGEHSRYLSQLRDPHPVEDPRVFFAGEHVSVTHAWIQGSIQSALEAVLAVLRKDS
ncbi:flavin monoamine oxidase family protein [Microbacterium enclense]|uniref:flavin monoamine oxidase family protein n=1 Tax=Microbacterium enclense TaxID=993073 RepID=UPI003D75054A